MPRSTENNADTTSEKRIKKKHEISERERERERKGGKKTLFRAFVDSIGWKLV